MDLLNFILKNLVNFLVVIALIYGGYRLYILYQKNEMQKKIDKLIDSFKKRPKQMQTNEKLLKIEVIK